MSRNPKLQQLVRQVATKQHWDFTKGELCSRVFENSRSHRHSELDEARGFKD